MASGGTASASGSVNKLMNLLHLAEYAKSARSSCKECNKVIQKGSVRFAKLVQSRYHDGKEPQWYHPKCFVKKYNTVTALQLIDFETLRWEDQESFRKLIEDANGKPKSGKSKRGKRKTPTESSEISDEKRSRYDDAFFSQIKDQVDLLYKMRDKVEEHFENDKKTLTSIIKHNNSEPPAGVDNMLNFLAEIMAFGSLDPCDCGGQLMYKSGSGGYQCTGNVTEYTKCQKIFEQPTRLPFKIPPDLKTHAAFKGLKFSTRDRMVPKYVQHDPPQAEVNLKSGETVSVAKADLPLHNMTFTIIGNFEKSVQQEMKNKLEQFGAVVRVRLSANVTAIISSLEDVTNKHPKLENVLNNQRARIPIISSSFVNNLNISDDFDILTAMKTHMLSNWCTQTHITDILQRKVSWRKYGHLGTARFTAYNLDYPARGVVDWECGLGDEEVVLHKEDGRFYACTLTKSSVEDNTNSYYRIQLITTTANDRFWVFRSWGRIGMSYGSHTLLENLSIDEALQLFKNTFLEKTGNEWGWTTFQKKPGMYDMVFSLQDEEDKTPTNKKKSLQLQLSIENSKLPMQVQELIAKLFSKKEMERTIILLKLDLSRFPIVSISRDVLLEAYKVLEDTHCLVDELTKINNKPNGNVVQTLTDLTNRFYSKIPHCFNSFEKPRILDNLEIIKAKTEVLDNLIEIFLAYDVLKEKKRKAESATFTIDAFYATLSTDLELLPTESLEYQNIFEYFTNSQSNAHNFKLHLTNMFRVSRHGEYERFEAFKDFENRRLLWHGSRTTNIAGILTHGLKISPPGLENYCNFLHKGIYFADVVTKSSRYCGVSYPWETGILLLCEVALGNILSKKRGVICYGDLSQGFDSIKVAGKYESPDMLTLSNGLQIPVGTPQKTSTANQMELQHNEYIVFNEAQINIKYLITFQKENELLVQ